MSENHPDPRHLSELEQTRLRAARAEVRSIGEAAVAGELAGETLVPGIEAVKQIPLDPARALNAFHVPEDAGEYAEGLKRILERIPDGWGRWIDCGAGWYPIVVGLAEGIAELIPEYEIHQVKEKYGTLRFYWGTPHREPACCETFNAQDPRPYDGAITGPFAPKGRDPEEQRLLEEWLVRYEAHLSSDEHAQVTKAASAAVDRERAREIGERIERLVDAAEEASARTCERCGSPGLLHQDHGWFRTLCPGCAAGSGYVPNR